MKKATFLVIAALVSFSFCKSNSAPEAGTKALAYSNQEKIEVYYFHVTRRCATCNAVEAEARNVVTDNFSALLSSGGITFRVLNYDEPEGREIADKLGVTGQILLVIQGDVRKDLTSESFMYALSSPEKMRELLQKTINEMLK